MPLRSTRSSLNSQVTLITAIDPSPGTPPPASPGLSLKRSPPTPIRELSPYVSLRRSTRSTTTTTDATLVEPAQPIASSSKLNLSTYAYAPPTPSPRKRVKIEVESPVTPLRSVEAQATPKSLAKKAKPLPLLALEKPHPEPPRWREQYRLIEHMRKGIIAPVDDMGCERPRTTKDIEPKTLRFHILISLMLSSQTKDAITSQAVTNLHHTLPGGLTAESLVAASTEMIHECINKVGFWRRKTEYITEAARALLEKEGDERGDVPKTLEGLCELKGVGPKMAFLALQCAWDINAGIGVDVHVHRITNRLKWHKPPTTDPEKTRLNLQSWLPPELHKSINPMLVGFGQVVCLPVGPRCDVCLLGQRKMCPSRNANVKAEGRKEVVYTFKAEDYDDGAVETAKAEIKYEGDGDEVVKLEMDEVEVKAEP